jgi:hypothetical protein
MRAELTMPTVCVTTTAVITCLFILKMEAALSSEMFVNVYKTAQCYVIQVNDRQLNHLIAELDKI